MYRCFIMTLATDTKNHCPISHMPTICNYVQMYKYVIYFLVVRFEVSSACKDCTLLCNGTL
jgi:hypothetical protein